MEGEPEPGIDPELPNVWIPGVVEHIASFLPPNEVPCSLRLLDRATAVRLAGESHATVHLSQPAPPLAFAAHWRDPAAARALSAATRYRLIELTAASGVVPNVEVALAAAELPVKEWALNTALRAAASAGRLEVCQWARRQLDGGASGALLGGAAAGEGEAGVLEAAARGGHLDLCNWLLTAAGCPWSWGAVFEAARGGHVGLMDWLLGKKEQQQRQPGAAAAGWRMGPGPCSRFVPSVPEGTFARWLAAAAEGCDLATLQRIDRQRREWSVSRGGLRSPLGGHEKSVILAAAASSPAADWRAKVEWLEGRGFSDGQLHQNPQQPHELLNVVTSCEAAMTRDDAASRLAWLLQRGYAAGERGVANVASRGNLAALRCLLGAGAPATRDAALRAAQGGHLAVLQELHTRGCSFDGRETLRGAVGSCQGVVEVARWLVDTLGARECGLCSGCDGGGGGDHGGGNGGGIGSGDEGSGGGGGRGEAVRELMQEAAASGNRGALTWLREGTGAGWDERVFTSAATSAQTSEDFMAWLVEQGCPMPTDGQVYVAAARHWPDLPKLRALRRLGCPFSPSGATFSRAVNYGWDRGCHPCVLRWLLEEGCPVDWEWAVRAGSKRGDKHAREVREWLQAERAMREG